ncbi:hypothetical protein AB0M57_10905 [Streptomyces sp. NPDC051597]|uniref:hypothetical protein n=1 Tax=Streptomyces sp. NPDC051597 TaxID=3155049 RepID=UPI0034387D1E
MTILALVIVAVIGLGHADTGTSGADQPGTGTQRGDRLPRPDKSVTYPITWPDQQPHRPRPSSTVHYPIPWDRSQGTSR